MGRLEGRTANQLINYHLVLTSAALLAASSAFFAAILLTVLLIKAHIPKTPSPRQIAGNLKSQDFSGMIVSAAYGQPPIIGYRISFMSLLGTMMNKV